MFLPPNIIRSWVACYNFNYLFIKTIAGLKDVLKTTSRQVLEKSSILLWRINFLTSKTSYKYVWRTSWWRVEDISQDDLKKSFKISSRHLGRQKQLRWSRLQDGWKKCLEDGWKTCLEDGWKTCLESVLKKSWRHLWNKRNVLLRISVFNHSLLTNLNQYVTNLYLTNLYFTNLRRIQNALIRT